MGLFCDLFPVARVSTDIRQILFALITDNAATVRNIACESTGALLTRLYKDDTEAYTQCMQQYRELSSSNTFLQRQLFVRMCEGMVSCHASVPGLWAELLPNLLRLARDPISNVRLALAKLLRRSLWEKEAFTALQPQVIQILAILSKDEDKDIYNMCQVAAGSGMDETEDERRPGRSRPNRAAQSAAKDSSKDSKGAWL
jgi:hypothetical protein